MLKTMADRHDTRPVWLLYAYSRWDRMTCRDVLESLRERLTLTVVYVVEQPTADWPGERGWITHDVLARHLPEGHREAEYFVCGPQAMTRAMEQLLHGLGVPLSRVHSELFELV